MGSHNDNEVAVFGGGCFWCTEAVFQSFRGVNSVLPGYAGGGVANPSYEQVSGGETGHAEVTKIEFNPTEISFENLLDVFFATHDPTTLNRQGNDVGTQYRSVIFYTNKMQKEAAEKYIKFLENDKVFESPIATQIEALDKFYVAENYHQNYFKNNPSAPYCRAVIDHKISKLRAKFSGLLK